MGNHGVSCCTNAAKACKRSHSKVFELKKQSEMHGNAHMHHKEREAQIDAFIKTKLAKGVPWTDLDFPPSQESLFNVYTSKLNEHERVLYDSLTWRRASEVYPSFQMQAGDYNIFSNFSHSQPSHNYFIAYLRTLPNL